MHIGWFVSRRLHSREACKLLLFTLPMHYGLSWIRKDVRDRPFVSLRRKVETLQCISWTVNNCQFIETNASQATPYALNIVVVANIKSRNRAFSTHTHTTSNKRCYINHMNWIMFTGICVHDWYCYWVWIRYCILFHSSNNESMSLITVWKQIKKTNRINVAVHSYFNLHRFKELKS